MASFFVELRGGDSFCLNIICEVLSGRPGETSKSIGMSPRSRPDTPASSARNPGVPIAVTTANLPPDRSIQGAALDTIASSSEQVYQLSKLPTGQDAAPLTGEPAQSQEAKCTNFAEKFSAVVDLAPFPDAAKPASASAMCVSSISDAFE